MNVNNYSNNKNIYPNNNYIYNEINNNYTNNESFQSNNKNQSNKINNNNYNRNKKIKNNKNKKEEFSNNNKKNTKDDLKTKSNNKSGSRNKQKSMSKKDSSSKNPKSFETNEINNNEEDKIKKSEKSSPKINIYKKATSDKSNINYCIGTEEMFRDEEILQELNEAKMKAKERLDKDNEDENYDNEKSEDNLYRLNIRDTTPENIKENIVIPSNKYKNFFDIEGIQEL